MREQREIGRWAEQLVAHPGAQGEPLRAVALALAGLTAGVESRPEDARRLSTDALAAAAEPTDGPGGSPTTRCRSWPQPRPISRSGRATSRPWRLTAGPPATPWPKRWPSSTGCSSSRWPATRSGARRRPRRCSTWPPSGPSPRCGPWRCSPTPRSFAPDDPARAGAELREALALASTASNTIVAQQALRALQELNARSGGHAAALASLRRWRALRRPGQRSRADADAHQHARLAGRPGGDGRGHHLAAVSRTPFHPTARVLLIDTTVAERLDRDRHVAARRAGASMTSADLVAYASPVKELAGDLGPLDDRRLDELRTIGDPEADALAATSAPVTSSSTSATWCEPCSNRSGTPARTGAGWWGCGTGCAAGRPCPTGRTGPASRPARSSSASGPCPSALRCSAPRCPWATRPPTGCRCWPSPRTSPPATCAGGSPRPRRC